MPTALVGRHYIRTACDADNFLKIRPNATSAGTRVGGRPNAMKGAPRETAGKRFSGLVPNVTGWDGELQMARRQGLTPGCAG